ncbi:hypothetical protein ACGF12_28685 [Kitasatospora sp. NPDC048296]|uniref:hypothetical protein n=1 Tax=Kitasatospora sp. NPDC048296 TaxID=3364048 RepID=UPI00372446F7
MTALVRSTLPAVEVRDGLATLGPQALLLRTELDTLVVRWAQRAGAANVAFPPLLTASDLARFDYFTNFPHLGLVVAPIAPDRASRLPRHPAAPDARIEAADLGSAVHMLPSAACYTAYANLAGRRFETPAAFTLVAQCYRREDEYDGLRRLCGFTMREVVLIGGPEEARQHLADFTSLIHGLSDHLGLDLRTEIATDPFFDPDGSRAVMQRLFPVKREFLSADGTAVASVNYHRNFFGERADLRIGEEVAHTSCVAFGLERWLHALGQRFEGDLSAALRAVRAYTADQPS